MDNIVNTIYQHYLQNYNTIQKYNESLYINNQ